MALSGSVQPIVLTVATNAAAFFLAWLAYLAFFHPLAKYPGPFLAKFTHIYAAYHGWKGDLHLDMWKCHQQYGDYVRYGPNQLMFSTANALKDIYGYNSASNFIKAQAYAPMIHRAPNTLTIRGGKDHARRRRIMAQSVSEKAQRGYARRIASHIGKLCDIAFPNETDDASRTWSKPMDMSKWCNYLSFDIMSDIVFGAKYNLLGNESFRYVPESIDKSNIRMGTLIQFPNLAALKIDKYLFPDAILGRNVFVKFVVQVVKDRLRKNKTTSADINTHINEDLDVFANLTAAKDPETGEGLCLDDIAAESTTLIVAGSDTTSTAIAAVFFYLSDNKNSYNKVADEVRSKFSSREEVVMGATLASCAHLRACIDESLRMSPPVGAMLWREVMPGCPAIDSHNIPAGVDVGVPIYTIHHEPRYYTEPFTFKPERWLVDDGTGSIERARSVFNPFSIGIRSCLGKGLATSELMMTMATILVLGDFKFADGENGDAGRGKQGAAFGRHRPTEYQLYDHVTGQKNGPFLQFSRRKAH